MTTPRLPLTLEDPDPTAFNALALAAASLGPAAIPALMLVARDSPAIRGQLCAIKALGMIPGAKAIEARRRVSSLDLVGDRGLVVKCAYPGSLPFDQPWDVDPTVQLLLRSGGVGSVEWATSGDIPSPADDIEKPQQDLRRQPPRTADQRARDDELFERMRNARGLALAEEAERRRVREERARHRAAARVAKEAEQARARQAARDRRAAESRAQVEREREEDQRRRLLELRDRESRRQELEAVWRTETHAAEEIAKIKRSAPRLPPPLFGPTGLEASEVRQVPSYGFTDPGVCSQCGTQECHGEC
jgi:hypothetical protein